MKPISKRGQKSANYSTEENRVLYSLYRDNYQAYHENTAGGTGRTRNKLLEEWSNHLSLFGVDKREPSKIQEKLKKDFQKARSLLLRYRKHETEGETSLPHPRISHPHYDPLFDILENCLAIKSCMEVESVQVHAEGRLQTNEIKLEEGDEQEMDETNRSLSSIAGPSHPTDLSCFLAANNQSESNLNVTEIETEIAMLKRRKLMLECELLEKQIRNVDAEYAMKYSRTS